MTYYPYKPRKIYKDLGIWQADKFKFKVYGVVAEHREITESILNDASSFLHKDVVKRANASEDSEGLGFIIIHPGGDGGVSILAQWWIQGSVMCQYVKRWLKDSSEATDMSSKHVVGCVWELGLINAEQIIWRNTMMGETSNVERYLETRPTDNEV